MVKRTEVRAPLVALQRGRPRLRVPAASRRPDRRPAGRLCYEGEADIGAGFIRMVLRHTRGERPVAFLKAIRKRSLLP